MPSPRQPAAKSPKDKESAVSRVTLRDIAKKVGVSAMTVSRALRNQPRISEALRRRIKARAAAMGYRPDPALSALVHYRHKRSAHEMREELAWLNFWPDPRRLRAYREFDLYWHGASKAAERLGFRLVEFAVDGSMPAKRLAAILNARNVRGILLPPGLFHPAWNGLFPWGRFSVVGLSDFPDLPIHTVGPDQMRNAMHAHDRMRGLGYGRIGFVSVRWRPRSFGAGVGWAQEYLGEDAARVPLCLLPDDNLAAHREQLHRWLVEHGPDAILTDLSKLPEALKGFGLHVPADVGMAALSVLDCPIDAGIHQNPEEIGRVAVLVVTSLINDNDRGFPGVRRSIKVEGRWVDGASLPVKKGRSGRGRAKTHQGAMI